MKEQIKQFYSNLHFPGKYSLDDLKFYDENGIHNMYLKVMDAHLTDGLEVLDIGCGTGLVTNVFARKYPKSNFTGVDFSNSIEYAKNFARDNNIKNTKWIKKDFLLFDSEKKYDVIICCGVLHHIPEDTQALKNMKALLKPGGKLLLAVYNKYGKILKHLVDLKYNCEILYQDQENNPFELSYTNKQVHKMCKDLTFHSVTPSVRNHLVDFLAWFNSENGGLALYVFTKS